MIHHGRILLLTLLFASLAHAQTSNSLGKVSFPISCAPGSQAEFERGVALMHSFQYPGAQPVFAGIAEKDPQCAMAWWGQAMNLYHQLWNWPDKDALRKGHEFILKAEAAGAKTERERMYIEAAAAYFSGQDADATSRVKAYTAKMADLWKQNPQDIEAGSFYALALLSSNQPDAARSRNEAIAILQDLFARVPDHPGVDHYLIHATDQPELAAQGLKAAQRYAVTAPASPHALHMPSHIFAQLGMWQAMIDSNRAAAEAAAEAARKDKSNGASYQVHPMHYLHYAYMQTARDAEARKLVESLKDVPAIEPDEITDEGMAMKALEVMETQQWKLAEQLDDNAPTVPLVRIRVHWAKTIAAAHLGDRKAAERQFKKLSKAIGKQKRGAGSKGRIALEAEAWLDFVRGKGPEAAAKMREAADGEEFGVDGFYVPAREQLGDLLLALKRPAEALEAYKASLKVTPGRFNSLFGAGRAAEITGNREAASRYYGELAKMADPASDRPQLKQAKDFLAGR